MVCFILNNFNNALSSSEYPASLNVWILHQFSKRMTKPIRLRPMSILPNLGKIYERFMQNQLYPYLNQIFSKYQSRFRKGFNTQQFLMTMIEKWRSSLAQETMKATSLRLNWPWIIDCQTKSSWFWHWCVKNLFSFLWGRKQRTNINSSYSSFAEILFGVS